MPKNTTDDWVETLINERNATPATSTLTSHSLNRLKKVCHDLIKAEDLPF